MLMLVLPQAYADIAICSERVQRIYGRYGCFLNNVLQNICVPGLHNRNTAHLWFSQIVMSWVWPGQG